MFKRMLDKDDYDLVMTDRVIVFDNDQKTCQILQATEVTEEVVRKLAKTFPRQDLELSISQEGRVWFFRAPSNVIDSTEHLAQVEKNTIIQQIAQYKKPVDEAHKSDWTKGALIAGIIIMGIVAAV